MTLSIGKSAPNPAKLSASRKGHEITKRIKMQKPAKPQVQSDLRLQCSGCCRSQRNLELAISGTFLSSKTTTIGVD